MFKNKKGYLSVSDVNVIKGVALILLLWHHLFYKINGLFDDIILFNGHFLINELGRICKMCVAIFVFLSGYGLTRQAEIKGGLDNLVQWYRHRFLKLMVNYWLIWLLFVPIGVFVFGRTLTDAYQTHVIWKFLADIFGMANAFGFHGYNGTWWFVTCILLLYLLYPLLYRGSKHSTWVVLLIGLVASFLPISTGASSIHPYLFPFVFGIAVALRPLPDLPAGGRFCTLLVLPLLVAARILLSGKVITDSFIALTIIYIIQSFEIPNPVTKSLAFIGRHSMNIFMFHTFIFSHWLTSFIYYPRNPFLIFLLLLIVCLAISVVIEWIKSILRFSQILSSK